MHALSPLLQVSRLIDLIGKTPLIELPSDDGLILAKCEQYNPGGSVKDRIGLAMINQAEEDGLITPGKSVIVEPTSGNTGIGLALVCAAKGYRLILTMPASMSLERRALLQSYGAEIVLTPAEQVMDGAVAKAHQLCAANTDYFMPNQFQNRANPKTHAETTAIELLEQLGDDRPDAFVSSVGTGGTITGVGCALKKKFPAMRIIAVEPAGSAVISGNPPGPHKIQGIGAGFIPATLDRDLLDAVRTVSDMDAYKTKVELAKKHGLLVGISSGANLFVARQVARELGPGHVVLTVLCDTGERYFSLDEYFRQTTP